MARGKFRRNISLEEVKKVHSLTALIEQCLLKYMSQQEVTEFILEQAKIEPVFTKTVWKELEEGNPDFFRAYHVKLIVKQQITLFNSLLAKQLILLEQPLATGALLNSDSNGSYIPQFSCPPLQNMNHTVMSGEITKQGPDDAVITCLETWDETLNASIWESIDIDLHSKPNPLNFSQSAANICHGSTFQTSDGMVPLTVQQGSASYAPEHISQGYMHALTVSRSPLQNMNHTGAAMSAHGGRIGATQNMFHSQSLDNCSFKGINGEIIKLGPDYDVNRRQETRDETLNGVGDISQDWEYMDVDLFSKQIPCDLTS